MHAGSILLLLLLTPGDDDAPAPRRFPTTFEVAVRDRSPTVDPSRTVVRER